MSKDIQIATLGGGCFWCTEAVFQEVRGVEKVVSGYAGGNAPGRPTYREICSGLSGFAEVIRITFDATTISYESILVIFFTTHDPTTLNRQGADRGTQYRSVIYHYSENQQKIAEEVLMQIQSYFSDKIMSCVTFFMKQHKNIKIFIKIIWKGYCSFVIEPKLAKLRKLYADKLK